MTTDQARKWIILSSIVITGAQIIFLFIGPALGFPLIYPKNLELLQIITPVFLGYLGSATHFIFIAPTPLISVNNQFLGLLIKGPILIYAFAIIAAFTAFAYSNRIGAQIGGGMSVENLGTALSISLGVLAGTTGVITSYLFVANQSEKAPVKYVPTSPANFGGPASPQSATATE